MKTNQEEFANKLYELFESLFDSRNLTEDEREEEYQSIARFVKNAEARRVMVN